MSQELGEEFLHTMSASPPPDSESNHPSLHWPKPTLVEAPLAPLWSETWSFLPPLPPPLLQPRWMSPPRPTQTETSSWSPETVVTGGRRRSPRVRVRAAVAHVFQKAAPTAERSSNACSPTWPPHTPSWGATETPMRVPPSAPSAPPQPAVTTCAGTHSPTTASSATPVSSTTTKHAHPGSKPCNAQSFQKNQRRQLHPESAKRQMTLRPLPNRWKGKGPLPQTPWSRSHARRPHRKAPPPTVTALGPANQLLPPPWKDKPAVFLNGKLRVSRAHRETWHQTVWKSVSLHLRPERPVYVLGARLGLPRSWMVPLARHVLKGRYERNERQQDQSAWILGSTTSRGRGGITVSLPEESAHFLGLERSLVFRRPTWTWVLGR